MTEACHRDDIVYEPIGRKYSEYVNIEKVNWWLLRSRLLEGQWCKCAAWLEQSPLQLTLVIGHVDHQSIQSPKWSKCWE